MKTLKFALLCAIFTSLVSVASAQESKKENSATKPAPRDKGWEKRHETFVVLPSVVMLTSSSWVTPSLMLGAAKAMVQMVGTKSLPPSLFP